MSGGQEKAYDNELTLTVHNYVQTFEDKHSYIFEIYNLAQIIKIICLYKNII